MRVPVVKQKIIRRSDIPRTTIILTKKTLGRLKESGRYNETLDDILNRLVYYDIKIHGLRVEK